MPKSAHPHDRGALSRDRPRERSQVPWRGGPSRTTRPASLASWWWPAAFGRGTRCAEWGRYATRGTPGRTCPSCVPTTWRRRTVVLNRVLLNAYCW